MPIVAAVFNKDYPSIATLAGAPHNQYILGPSAPASHVEYLRQRYKHQQLSEKATELMLASWREKSSKTYESQFQKWASRCGARSIDCPIGDVANFIAEMSSEGYQYRSINAYRLAISSVHSKVDGYEVGQHPLISRLLKGIYHQRPPPRTRYMHTWDVAVVTTYIRARGDNTSLSLQDVPQVGNVDGPDQTL
jgi:hypothetical protein